MFARFSEGMSTMLVDELEVTEVVPLFARFRQLSRV
jgi:hypothetical protein